MNWPTLLFGAATLVLVILTFWYKLRTQKYARQMADSARLLLLSRERAAELDGEVRTLLSERDKITKQARADAVKRSRSVIKGRVGENFAPFLDNFPYNPSDCHFIGNPIDYLVFDGYSDDGDDINEVVLLEIKSGTSSLTTKQRRIRDAVKDGKVRWCEFRVE